MTTELVHSAAPLAGPPIDLVFGDTDAPTGVNLLYSRAPMHSAHVNLVFGEDEESVPGSTAAQLTIHATLPGVVLQARAADYRRATLTGVLPALSFVAEMAYASKTQRPTVNRTAAPWDVPPAPLAGAGVQSPMQGAQAMPTGNQAPWTQADPLSASAAGAHAQALPSTRDFDVVFDEAARLGTPAVGDRFGDAIRTLSPSRRAPHQDAQRVGTQGTHLAHQDAYRDRRAARQSLWQEALHNRGLRVKGVAGKGLARPSGTSARHQNAIRPPAGVSTPVIIVPPKERCYTPDPNLLFKTPWSSDLNLVFICDRGTGPPTTETIVVPVRRVYMIINNATLRRVDGNIQLSPLSMSLSLDVDSWTWSMSATLPGNELAYLEPAVDGARVELEAMVNGVAYRALVESIGRAREFAKSSISIQCRGLTSLLDGPTSPVMQFLNPEARTAQQLMGDVLTINGVPMDWTVNWGLEDWLVPAGVFSHQGSYISALNAIATAAGGYIQPHASLQQINVLPRYAAAPWTWNTITPDYELPSDVTTKEGINWVEKARYNRVYVSGQHHGVLGQVTREGTDGALLAPMVTDALITTAGAARQRGISILSNTGRQAELSLRLPVLSETGIIVPGKFVRYVDGATTRVGIVRSTAVEVGLPEIWQTLGVETHA